MEFKNKDRDRYDGCLGISFEKTGFFRLEKADRWWLVTPEGNAFLSFGINHMTPSWLQYPENRDFWLQKFGLSRVYSSEKFYERFSQKAKQDLKAFKMNTIGCHNEIMCFPSHRFCPIVWHLHFVGISPFTEPTKNVFRDVFSREFERHCDLHARKEVAPESDNPFIIGYSLCDVPILTEMDASRRRGAWFGSYLPTWPRVLRNAPPESSGKQAYVNTMEKRYKSDIAAFNQVYSTEFRSFDELRNTGSWRDRSSLDAQLEGTPENEDNLAFLEIIMERYYQVVTSAIRKYDKNHLILGNKLNGNTDLPDFVVDLTGKYMDCVFYQTYGDYVRQKPYLDRWYRLTGKPLFLGDASFSVPSEIAPWPPGPHCANQYDRAEKFKDLAFKAFSREDFVGWDWCGWMDGTYTHSAKLKRFADTGLQDPYGNYHKPMYDAFRNFSDAMYDIASGTMSEKEWKSVK